MLIQVMEEYTGEVDHFGDPYLDDFLESGDRVLQERGLDREFGLRAFRRGRWFLIGGRVDTYQTKSIVFGLVPEIEGARWIVDRLHVGRRH
jgi:hypothetical protein